MHECVCLERKTERGREKRERGGRGVQIFKFDLVCTDTGREGGVWSIHLKSRGGVRKGGGCSTVGLFYE